MCPLGGVSRMASRRCEALSSRTRCGLSVLCDALPERESTALCGEVGQKAGGYLSGPQPSCCPSPGSGTRTSSIFSFPLAAGLLKAESVHPKSKRCPNTQDGACSILLVYIAFHHSLFIIFNSSFCLFSSVGLVDC